MATAARAIPRTSNDDRAGAPRPVGAPRSPQPLPISGWAGPRGATGAAARPRPADGGATGFTAWPRPVDRAAAGPAARPRPADSVGATTRVIPGSARAAGRRGRGDGLGARAIAIGLGGLLLVGLAAWLIVSGVGMVLAGTVLVILVAYLAAASSRPSRLEAFCAARVRDGFPAAEPASEPPPDEGRGTREGADRWAAERASLQRQIARLEQQNAALAARLRQLEGWQRPLSAEPARWTAPTPSRLDGALRAR